MWSSQASQKALTAILAAAFWIGTLMCSTDVNTGAKTRSADKDHRSKCCVILASHHTSVIHPSIKLKSVARVLSDLTYEFNDVWRLLCGKIPVGRPLPPVLGPGEDVLQRSQGQCPADGRHANLAHCRSRLKFQMTFTLKSAVSKSFISTFFQIQEFIALNMIPYPEILLDLDDLPGERRLNVHVELDVGRLGRRCLLVGRELQYKLIMVNTGWRVCSRTWVGLTQIWGVPGLVGCCCSYLLPKQDIGTFQI